jgi:HAD superfamily hydrolase (TIGR01549 family)
MPPIIDAVLFDMGGTLRRTTRRTDVQRRESLAQLNALLGTQLSAEEWDQRLLPRAREYKRWAEETFNELTEEEIWTRWMLPDLPEAEIRPRALDLHRVWRRAFGSSEMRPQAGPVVQELFRRGYRLGIVSNTSSRTYAPEALQRGGILDCFEVVALSSVHGRRKPDRMLFDLTTHAMEIDPARCAFVGNRCDTDMVGARQAGFAVVVLLHSPDAAQGIPEDCAPDPDHWIDGLEELLTIFPPRFSARPSGSRRGASVSGTRWQAALSTMWGSPEFPRLDGFLMSAGEMGFSGVELNHEVNSAMLAGTNLEPYHFSSVHEPCPADVPTGRMSALDWQVSSEDEHKRKQAVRMVKRSIFLARELGAGLVVVHPGNAGGDRSLEKELRRLFNAGEVDSPRYRELRDHLVDHRSQVVGPRVEAAMRSLSELLACAHDEGILLGLENRYHYLDIPTPDEMQCLLSCASADELGVVYDVGHAQTMQRLGFFTHEDWLQRFADRIVEVHLHDVKGIDDHFAPGLGEVDFDRIAASLPGDTLRTCEVRPQNTPEQVVEGMNYLVRHGCVNAC